MKGTSMMLRALGRTLLAAFVVASCALARAEHPIRVEASVRQADGKILLVGNPSSGAPVISVGRLNADGTVDTGFGNGGWTDYPMPSATEFRATAVAALANGKVLVATRLDGAVALMRFEATGEPDPLWGFAGPGPVVDGYSAGFNANAIAELPDGNVLAFGSLNDASTGFVPRAAVKRYLPGGHRDPGYGTDGAVVLQMGNGSELRAVTRAQNGDLIAAGYAINYERSMLLGAFQADGTLAPYFGSGGWTATEFYGGNKEAFGVTVMSSGDIVAVGRNEWIYEGQTVSPLYANRYTANGTYISYHSAPIGINGAPFNFNTDSTALAVYELGGDLVMVGNTREVSTGRVQLSIARVNPQLGAHGTVVADVMGPIWPGHARAGYPVGADFVLVVGSQGPTAAESVLRARYFFDTLDFDSDYATDGADATANPLDFEAQGGLAAGETRDSDPRRVTGINVPAAISIANGSYSLGCDGNFTTAPGTVMNGQYVCVRTTGATSAYTATSATLTIGDSSHSFSVMTGRVPDTTIWWPGGSNARPPNFQISFYADYNVSGPATFECRIDAAPFAPCGSGPGGTSYHDFTNVAPGNHVIEVRAVNGWGVDPTPATQAVTVIAYATPTITSGPAPVVSGFYPITFTFTADEAGATFRCKYDNSFQSYYAPCTSPHTISVGPNGNHTFYVLATGAAGENPTPATWSFVSETTAPTVSFTSTPPNPSPAAVQFAFTANEPATFYCRLDGNFLGQCTSPYSATVSSGSHTFEVYARDVAGNASSTISRTWTADGTVPDTYSYGFQGPQGTVNTPTVQIDYQSDEANALFECRVDAGAWYACNTRPTSVTVSTQGTHTFEVRARDAVGNIDPTPAWRQWVLDSVAPETTILISPQAVSPFTTANFSWTANETGVTFRARLDGGPWEQSGSSRSYPGLAPGSHTLEVYGTDGVGNVDATPAVFTWVIDTTPPDTTLTGTPPASSNSRDATFNFTSETGATFVCSLDGGAYVACASPHTATALGDGTHTFRVKARDAAGNLDPVEASWTWTIDATSPDTAIATGPSGTVAQASAAFTFTSPDPSATFECSLDALAFATCASGVSYSGLADGMHMFEVRARDGAGNVDPTPATRTWSVDSTAPNTTITSGPDAVTSSTGATLAFSASEGATFLCKLDNAAYSACTSPQTFAALSAGSHAFSVYAVDAVGNADPTAATWSWVIDTAAPETAITSAPSGTIASRSASVAFSSPDGGATFECSLDGGAFAACTSPASLSGLADGPHAFQVRAKDTAGNVDASPASAAWTVDATAPVVSLTAYPPAASNSASATFTFSSTEGLVECRLDNGAYGACTSPKSYSGLAQGSHTFYVKATDAAGNVSQIVLYTWTIDSIAPDTTLTGGPSGGNNTNPVAFTFTASEAGSTFECSMDNAAFAACVSGVSYSGLAKGQHTFQVRARDAAGNVDASPASRQFGIK